MSLPNAEHAHVDMVKLNGYCLDPQHPDGKHKARVFRSALGIGPEHTFWLHDQLLRASITFDAKLDVKDDFGQRYVIDFELEGPGGRARVRSCWIVRATEDFPRFVTCYVLDRRAEP